MRWKLFARCSTAPRTSSALAADYPSSLTIHSKTVLSKNMMKAGNVEGKVSQDFYGFKKSPLRPVSNKVVTPDADELERNPRSRSAKLRIAERTEA
jgi:16S rRNA (cytosine1402-N4)-methyltransferase